MSVTMYAILGFAMMLILTAVLVSGKFTPSIPMIVIPIIFAAIMHPTFEDLSSWVTTGLKDRSAMRLCLHLRSYSLVL